MAGSLQRHPLSINIPAMPGRPSLRYFILLLLVSGWLLLIVSPSFLAEEYPLPAGAVYYFFSQVCHQIPERSFHWAGFPMAVCHRCLGIYLGFWLGVLGWPSLGYLGRRLLDRPRLVLVPAALLLLNTLTPNSPFDRVVTGLLAGFPVALFVWIGFEQLFGPESRGELHVLS